MKPYSEFYFTIAEFRLQGDPCPAAFQPDSYHRRYGDLTRKGFNVSTGISYDFVTGPCRTSSRK